MKKKEPEKVEELEEELEQEGFVNGFDLSRFSDPDRAEALIRNQNLEEYNQSEEAKLLATLDKKPTTMLEESNNNGDSFEVNHEYGRDEEYYVLTDEEADERVSDYWDDSRDYWVEDVKANNNDEGWDEWREEKERNCDRGEILNHYDGTEESETINGVTYYIYRTN